MDLVSVLLVLALSVLLFIGTIPWARGSGSNRKRAPEASGAWPLLGHLHLLAVKVPPFRVLGDMADKYGPIFSVRLGRKPTLIVSSWEIAKECFGTHDKVFLDRPYTVATKQSYGGAMFALTSRSGQYWRNMRRISTHELLSNTRLELHKNVQSSEVMTCIRHLFSLCRNGSAKVDMSEWSALVTLNVMTQVVARKSCGVDGEDAERRRLVKSMVEFMNLIGTFMISDVVPFTEWMDLQGHFKAVKRAIEEIDRFISGCLQEHVRRREENKVKDDDQDFIDVMLSLIKADPSLASPHSLEVAIKSTLWILITAGAETSANMIVWTLSQIANHQEVLHKVQTELDTHVGKERWVEESDMRNLVYLVAVIKETLRLSVPLDLPRESIEDCIIGGYHVPKGTTLIVNTWKLHRDPRVWSDPDEFQPERFLMDVDASFNSDKKFKFMPFSVGRRSCPGATLAMQMMSLVIARVLQGFNLNTQDGKKVNMTEGFGVTNPKATPLELIVTPRLPHELYL